MTEGKTFKNRLHLDVNPTDREQDEDVRRLLDLGARHADVGQGDENWVVPVDVGDGHQVYCGQPPWCDATVGAPSGDPPG